MQKIRILTELSPAHRKPHGLNAIFRLTHVLCQEWSCRYFLRHETKNWSHFTLSCCYIAGIPTTLFFIWGKPSCFLYETVSCLLKAAESVSFRSKYIFCYKKLHTSKLSIKVELYHKTSLIYEFRLRHLSVNTTLSVAFYSLYNSVAEEIRTAMSIVTDQFMHFKW